MSNIHKLLKIWGEKNRQLPENNEVLKSEMLKRSDRLIRTGGATAKRLPWLSFALAGLAVLAFFVKSSTNYSTISVQSSRESIGIAVPMNAPAFDKNYFVSEPAPITDDREFLKTGYQAEIRTRQADEKTERIQLIVRGLGGRVDSMQISEKTGYISFALPENKFETFHNEMKDLVRDRFLTENISATNLLPQKQSIEEQHEAITKQLGDLKAQRSALISQHNRTVASLNAQIAASQDETEKQALRAQLASENASYGRKLASLDSQIKYAESDLANINKQDKQLIDNVATVQGTISLRWISLFDVINLYVGPYWLPIILLIAAIIAYFINRRRKLLLSA